MKIKKWLTVRLDLFDGAAGAGDGAGGAAQDGGGSAQGGTQAGPGTTRRGRSGGEYVLFGRQEAQSAGAPGPEAGRQKDPSDAGKGREAEVQTTSSCPQGARGIRNEAEPQTAAQTLDEKRRAFRELVTGEYKDIYTEETQRVIDRRFKETKSLQEQVQRSQPVIDMLMQRYKITDGDYGKLTKAIESDDAYWSEAAGEAGLSVEQYKAFQRLQRDNEALRREQRQRQSQMAAEQQLQRWYGEAEQVKSLYPSFDLSAEVQNDQFLSMLKAGVPVQHAYEVIHMDEIKAGVAQMTAQATEKQVVDGIRAKGARPQENGTTAQSGFTVKDDVSKLTKKDRAEIARRAALGERIVF